MEGKASSNQGVVLLNKRLNLPFTGMSSLSFMLQNTGTTRLGYRLLVFSPSQRIGNEAWGNSLQDNRTQANEPEEVQY